MIPQGGNTGLAGGTYALPGRDHIILSLSRMNAIREIRPEARLAIVEAGVVLETLHRAAEPHGLIYPMTFGAKGSCTIGGNLATNAGGSNVLRYGNTRDLVLGIEAVLPNGDIVDLMSELHKDNTGYALRHLLIASLLLPLALPLHAADNSRLPSRVEKALKANKINPRALSVMTVPLTGPGTRTVINADISVNPASAMKLVTTYSALELLGPTHQWTTEFHTEGTGYAFEKQTRTAEQMTAFYEELLNGYPLVSIEDPLGEDDGVVPRPLAVQRLVPRPVLVVLGLVHDRPQVDPPRHLRLEGAVLLIRAEA